jgi:hypothetical protein
MAGEHLDLAAVHPDRNRDGELPLGLAEYPVDARIQVELDGSAVEPRRHRVERVLLVRNGAVGAEVPRAAAHERVRRRHHHHLQRDGNVNRVSAEAAGGNVVKCPAAGIALSHASSHMPHRRLAGVA